MHPGTSSKEPFAGTLTEMPHVDLLLFHRRAHQQHQQDYVNNSNNASLLLSNNNIQPGNGVAVDAGAFAPSDEGTASEICSIL